MYVDDVRGGCTRTGTNAEGLVLVAYYSYYTTLIGTGSYVEGRMVRPWLWFGPGKGHQW